MANQLRAERATGEAASPTTLWDAVDSLIDNAPNMDALWWHGLHLLAGLRLSQRGLPVDPFVLEEQRAAALGVMSAPVLLGRIREVCEGPIILIKGYEVALRYRDPALRAFVDLDLLVEDAVSAQRALLAAGFVEVGDPEQFVDIHHQRPLWLPGLHLSIELHHAPKWPERLQPPPTTELSARAVPSASNVAGISALPPAEHALILAAHSWAHLPLRRIQELVDIAAVTEQADRDELAELSRDWGLERIWKTTVGGVDSLFYGVERTSAQRIWARHLVAARERTVFESHVQKWLSAFWALPWPTATAVMAAAIADEFSAGEGETAGEKLRRVQRAIRNAFVPRSKHDTQLGPGAHRRRRR